MLCSSKDGAQLGARTALQLRTLHLLPPHLCPHPRAQPHPYLGILLLGLLRYRAAGVNAPVEIEPSPEVSLQLNNNEWKQLGCLKKYAMLSFLCFLIPVQVLPLPGQVLIGTGSLSHAGLLQMGPTGYVALTYGRGFPLAG